MAIGVQANFIGLVGVLFVFDGFDIALRIAEFAQFVIVLEIVQHPVIREDGVLPVALGVFHVGYATRVPRVTDLHFDFHADMTLWLIRGVGYGCVDSVLIVTSYLAVTSLCAWLT